jgi:hypothetical protein
VLINLPALFQRHFIPPTKRKNQNGVTSSDRPNQKTHHDEVPKNVRFNVTKTAQRVLDQSG